MNGFQLHKKQSFTSTDLDVALNYDTNVLNGEMHIFDCINVICQTTEQQKNFEHGTDLTTNRETNVFCSCLNVLSNSLCAFEVFTKPY